MTQDQNRASMTPDELEHHRARCRLYSKLHRRSRADYHRRWLASHPERAAEYKRRYKK